MINQFYVGYKIVLNKLTNERFFIPADDFLRHAFICGSTGTGKTVLGKILIEEAVKSNISAVIIDLKGDLSSLAIPIINFTPDEVMPWIGKKGNITIEEAQEYINYFKKRLKFFNVSDRDIKDFRKKSEFLIYTPRSRRGEKFSLAELYSSPENVEYFFKEEPEIMAGMIQNMAKSLLIRIYPNKSVNELIIMQAYLEEVIRHLWLANEVIEGIKGIELLIKRIINPTFKRIGLFSCDDFISADIRIDMARRFNTLIVGSQRTWFEGKSINNIVSDIYNSKHPKIAIFNLTELESFEDKSLVVAQIGYTIYNIYRRTHSDKLKLMFYIDEIGGGDNNAFFPPEPFTNQAKPAINLLLRQGRAFGVGMILSTQNPGDIDYKGLTNCHTWFIGKLLTAEDRKKVVEGLSQAEVRIDKAEDFIRDAKEGCFMVRTRNGKIFEFQERWLYSIHKILGDDDIGLLSKELVKKKKYLMGHIFIENGEYDKAISHYKMLIKENPDDAINYLELVDIYMDYIKDINKAVSVINMAYKTGIAKELLDFKRAKIFFREGKFDKAKALLEGVIQFDSENEEVYYMLASINYKFYKLNDALKYINLAIKYNFQNPDYWKLKLKIYEELENFDGALDTLKVIRGFFPDDVGLFMYEGILLYYKGDIDEAKKRLDNGIECGEFYFLKYLLCETKDISLLYKAVSKNEELDFALIEYTAKLIESKEFERAKGFIDKLFMRSEYHPEYWYLLAYLQFSGGKYEVAKDSINRALNVRNEYKYFLLSGRVKKQLGDLKGAINDLKKARDFKPDYCEIYVELGELLIEKDPDMAVELLDEGILRCRDKALFYYKSIAQVKANFPLEALSSIDEYIRTFPDDIRAWKIKKEIMIKLGKYDKAKEFFIEVVKKYPEKLKAYEYLVDVLILLKEFNGALEWCDKGLEKFPKSIDLWRLLVVIYKEMGEYEKVMFCENKIQELSRVI